MVASCITPAAWSEKDRAVPTRARRVVARTPRAARGLSGAVAVGLTCILAAALAGNARASVLSIMDLHLEVNPLNHLSAVVVFETSSNATASVSVVGPDGSWTVPAGGVLTPSPGRAHRIAIVGLRSARTYYFDVTATDRHGRRVSNGSLTYTPAPNPPDFPPVQVTVHEPGALAGGLTLLGINRGVPIPGIARAGVFAIDADGEVVWYYRFDGIVNHVMQLANGNILYLAAGVHEVDLLGNEVRRWDPQDLGLANLHHDFVEMPNGHFLSLAAEMKAIDGFPDGKRRNLVGDVVVEFTPDGKVVDRLSLFDVLDPHRVPNPESFDTPLYDLLFGVPTKDWTHTNGLIYVPEDDSVILSVRHQNVVCNIDRRTRTLKWVIGEDEPSTSGDDEWPFLSLVGGGLLPSHQHGPALLSNGHVMMYDNGNYRPDPVTRAVEFTLNLEDRTLVQSWDWIDPSYDPPLFATFGGDVVPLPDDSVLVADVGLVEGNILFGRRWIHLVQVRRSDNAKLWEAIMRDDGKEVPFSGYNAVRIDTLYPPAPAAGQSFGPHAGSGCKVDTAGPGGGIATIGVLVGALAARRRRVRAIAPLDIGGGAMAPREVLLTDATALT